MFLHSEFVSTELSVPKYFTHKVTLPLPHVFRLFFPINEGWTHSVNTSSFVYSSLIFMVKSEFSIYI